jgi:hemolysin activation/secretion protein
LPAGHYSVEAIAPEEPTLRSGQVELDVTAGEQRRLNLEL